ncbi:MAG: hypothetical protein HY368_01050 [Candidatus Aenigmarchaeota archaeon]|nr:hypothetical protein [Candidatus Aenigmarchaeota archaeon]
MAQLYMIGIAHSDPYGPRRLDKMLHHIRPEAISVEMTQKGAVTAQRFHEMTLAIASDPAQKEAFLYNMERAGFNRETVEAVFVPDCNSVVGFEWLVPKLYWEPRGVDVYAVDTERARTGIAGTETEYLMKLPFRELTAELEKWYRTVAEGKPPENLSRVVGDFVDSDAAVERRLRDLCAADYGIVVHVGGMIHSFTRYPGNRRNLYQRLSDLRPKKFGLHEADSLV